MAKRRTDVEKDVNKELDDIAKGTLGGSEESQTVQPIPDVSEIPPYYGFGDLDFQQAEKLAYRRLEEYANNVYVETSYNMVMDGYGGSVVLSETPLSEDTIKSIIYDNLLKNREKYFVEPAHCETACTDGESIYINPYFAAWLTPEELAFVLAHEINHIMLRHVGDRSRSEAFIYGMKVKDSKDLDKNQAGLYKFRANIANIAEDLIINDQLTKDGIGKLVKFKKPPMAGKTVVCYIKGFADLSAEESIIKFSNAVCKNGYEIVNKSFAARGINVKPPVYKQSNTLTEARNELEVLYKYIFENARQFAQQQEQNQQQAQQQGQDQKSQPGDNQEGQSKQEQNSDKSQQGQEQGQDQFGDDKQESQNSGKQQAQNKGRSQQERTSDQNQQNQSGQQSIPSQGKQNQQSQGQQNQDQQGQGQDHGQGQGSSSGNNHGQSNSGQGTGNRQGGMQQGQSQGQGQEQSEGNQGQPNSRQGGNNQGSIQQGSNQGQSMGQGMPSGNNMGQHNSGQQPSRGKQQSKSKGKQDTSPTIGNDGSLDDMSKGVIGDAINKILDEEMMDKTAEEIAQRIAGALAEGAGGGKSLDSHESTEKLLDEIAKEGNGDVGEVEKRISESTSVLSSKVLEKLEAMGVNPEQLKGIGHIGANIVAKWQAKQVKARRPYDMMLTRMFKLIKGISRDTYARHNKKTTVINKALKNYAKKVGEEPSRVIIPNKLSEAGKIVIAIDTSGSIFADKRIGEMAVEEILRLTDTLNRKYVNSEIEVIMCDTQLHKYGNARNKYEMQKMLDTVKNKGLDVLGGGGTDLLPIWTYVQDEIKNARKKGHMPPSGLMVLTDTQTHNLNTITQLYLDRKFRTPTVILSTSNDIEYCKEWRELAQKCPYFMLADIDKIKEREQIRSSQGYDMER